MQVGLLGEEQEVGGTIDFLSRFNFRLFLGQRIPSGWFGPQVTVNLINDLGYLPLWFSRKKDMSFTNAEHTRMTHHI